MFLRQFERNRRKRRLGEKSIFELGLHRFSACHLPVFSPKQADFFRFLIDAHTKNILMRLAKAGWSQWHLMIVTEPLDG